MADKPPIGIIGVGWVGLVSSACFAELGHHVWCRDIDAQKIASLRNGDVTIFEPGLRELVSRNAERLHFEDELAPVLEHARTLFVCVDTPPTYSGDADLSRVYAVIDELPDSDDHAIVMKSTVPVGTGMAIKRRLDELGKSGMAYVSNPEFLKEGSAVVDFMQPDRVVVGSDEASRAADAVTSLFEPLDCPVVRTDVASAEMIKLASNAFLATKISFINEIANVCEEVGADVAQVADGMGLDPRIGRSFLNAGIGYGGSCLVGEETVLVRDGRETMLVTLERLFERLADREDFVQGDPDVVRPEALQALSWREGREVPELLAVSAVTRRAYEGELVEVRTKMGRRVRCTPDHPLVTADSEGDQHTVRLAGQLSTNDWLPVAIGSRADEDETAVLSTLERIGVTGADKGDIIVRPDHRRILQIAGKTAAGRNAALDHPRGSRTRIYDIVRTGALRLSELETFGLSLDGASLGTARNGTYIPSVIDNDEWFWRIVGLYIAEGHCTRDGRRYRLQWSFHPTKEADLVNEVADFWRPLGVRADVRRSPTAMNVVVSSRLLATWWLDVLGLGKNCDEQKIPDLAWTQPVPHKKALLSGLWHGDGSWSYITKGPSVILEYGTVSRALADGMLRLLGDLGIVGSVRVGRTAKSTKDTYWLRISGADQIEHALYLVPENVREEIRASIDRQSKRIAPTGYRQRSPNAAWVRVSSTHRLPYQGYVYSLEVPDSGTFVTTGGLVVHNCFPKDVAALKQLAGNSGYHFQLLTSVIEVNELQKRRDVNKLKKHLGSLVGRQIALLGLAFKPNTDDMREASSVVLAARLQGEGARVRAYDPVAEERARELITGAEMCDSALEVLTDADAAVIVTEWPEFAELDLEEARRRMKKPLIVDGRNLLSPDKVHAAGFIYEGIGRC